MVLELIIASTLIVSLLSIIGIISVGLSKKLFNKLLIVLVALSAGALMGAAFLHLIPESLEALDHEAFTNVLIGIVLFFFLEKFFFWRHCHNHECKIHSFVYMNLVGEALHNFIDGLIIASSFIISPELGFSSVIAVCLHEIPQELGDFGVLVYGGLSKKKALLYNFLIALTAIAGGVFGFYLLNNFDLSHFFISLAAGGFIYISASDLIPELRKEGKSVMIMTAFIIGILIMSLTAH